MKHKVCFVLGTHPVLSHPFLYNQIMEVVKDERYEVEIVIFNDTGEKIHRAYEILNDKVILFPIGTGAKFLNRLKLTLKSIFGLLFSRPIIFFKALNFRRYSRNALNFNYVILANHFRKLDADIIHPHFGTTARIIADLKEIGIIKSKILSSFHGKDITVYPREYGKKFYKTLYKVSEMFTGNSRFIISKMIEDGCPEDKIFKIPECINIDQFEYRGNAPERSVLKILTVGRFVEKKGYEYAIKAVAFLKSQSVAIEYNIVGEGPLKKDMINLAKEVGLEDSAIFHGGMKQEDLKKIYADSHIFLLPSVTAENGDTEGQGLVLQEAQAIGIPVVATLHNGFPDSIIDGKTGYLVPERDPVALFEKLVVLNNDERLCAEMGALGRKFVEESFDSKLVVKELLKLYEKLLQRQ